jgi:hypothetical protein
MEALGGKGSTAHNHWLKKYIRILGKCKTQNEADIC